MRIVGACGQVRDGAVLQAKGFPYPLIDLLADAELVRYYGGGRFATLRLTSSMYHRFHAPYDCRIEQVNYISGDTWNVNPIALRRVERLFCKNERAVIRCRLPSGALLTLVPVAAILVASIRLKFLDVRLHLRYRGREPDRVRRAAAQGRGDGLVRARLDHHRVRAAGDLAVRAAARGRADTDGAGIDADRVHPLSDPIMQPSRGIYMISRTGKRDNLDLGGAKR